MAAVDFYASVGGDDIIISDDADPNTGLANGGHRTRFIIALQQLVKVAAFVVARAQEAATAAASALGAPGTNSTSITPLLIEDGVNKTFITQTGKLWSKGQTLVAASNANKSNQMVGLVDSYNPATGQLVLSVAQKQGSGTWADWVISLTATGGVPITRKITGAGLAQVSGDGTFAADRTVTVSAATASQMRQRTLNTVAATPSNLAEMANPLVLPDNGVTLTWDMQIQPAAECTLTGGDRALATPTGGKKGLVYSVIVTQGDAGGRKLTLPAAVDKARIGDPEWSVGAGKQDILYLHCIDDTPGAPRFRLGFNGG